MASTSTSIPGVHFCTLNLEKSVRTVLENLSWTASSSSNASTFSPRSQRNKLIEQDGASVPNQAVTNPPSSSSEQIQMLSISPSEASQLAKEGIKHRQDKQKATLQSDSISSESKTDGKGMNGVGSASNVNGTGTGEGRAGAEDSWDEYPNGRFTDVRSPAYGEIDGWGGGLKITVSWWQFVGPARNLLAEY